MWVRILFVLFITSSQRLEQWLAYIRLRINICRIKEEKQAEEKLMLIYISQNLQPYLL